MKKFGLIGRDIASSSSPSLFRAAYGGKWSYDLLDGTDFKPLYERFVREYDAVNVTAPFKEQALAMADEASEEALLCSAANMLMRDRRGKVVADNSDFEGVTLSLMSAYAVQGVDVDDEEAFAAFLEKKTALVVGCGGAGKAAAAACLTLGFGKTSICNRDGARAEKFAAHLRNFYGDVSEDELQVIPFEKTEQAARQTDLIIYTLPCPLNLQWTFNADQSVLEANYRTPCLEQYGDRCSYISGLNWLYNQAAVSYAAFTGEEPDEDEMKNNLKQ